MRSKSTTIAVATLILVGCGAASAIASADPPAPPPGPPPGPPPASAPAPAPKTIIDHDGVYAVGTDIVPGTYSTPGPVGKGTCYWKRLSNVATNDIIDNSMTRKPQVVQIEPTDKAFKTDGCQPWQKNDAASPDPVKPPGPVNWLEILGGLNPSGGQPPPKP